MDRSGGYQYHWPVLASKDIRLKECGETASLFSARDVGRYGNRGNQ
jgi:hypothetical protein